MDKTCFVIMPFNNDLDSLYLKLKSICKEIGVNCKRSDEIAVGSISKGKDYHILRTHAVM